MSNSEGQSTTEVVSPGDAPSGGSVPVQRAGRRWPRRMKPSGAPQLDFPPVRNGLDYLASVVAHLDESQSGVTPRDVKYAVLHLQAAVEVLLKARLFAEHWTLVFADLNHATPKRRDSADFKSVTTEAAVTRLRNIVGVPISDEEQKALKNLSEDRNKLQHFGFTHDAHAVEVRAAVVLDFLIRFCDEQLVAGLADAEEQRETKAGLRLLREGLGNIESFARERMNRIGAELKDEGVENRTIKCPSCDKLALVLRQSPAGTAPDDWADVATCRYCSELWDTEELVGYFNEHGRPEEITEWNACPQCDSWSLGSGVPVRSNPEKPVFFCFSCAIGFPTVVTCVRCDRPVDGAGVTGAAYCGLCEMYLEDEQRDGPSHESPEDYGYTEEWG
ncbi:serine/arginine repetitive matrix protein 1 [Streptomyces microflavus]|uniref:serine/arginine repetitive matrix protein 1 n=1 Tax=Streptomyces microflavus TaxID=1919 RepID=UPI0038203F9F